MQALGISNADSGQKYTAASYEEVLGLAKDHGGDAVAASLFDRLAFSYLVGNDDHHLKNISFLHEPAFRLAPCYDVLASSLYGSIADSPMALAMLKDGKHPNTTGKWRTVITLAQISSRWAPERAFAQRLWRGD